MPSDDINRIDKIFERICELQKDNITVREEYAAAKIQFEKEVDKNILAIIDVLDVIEMTQNNKILGLDANATLVLTKINKRLLAILAKNNVDEIEFTDNKIVSGKARVLKTTLADDVAAGTILQICRKGYQRGKKIIRPADVITAANGTV